MSALSSFSLYCSFISNVTKHILVYDLVNVAEIHNTSIQSSTLLTNSTLLQLSTLANAHEWALEYNATSTARSIAGMVLAAEITAYLNSTITSSGASKLGIQFGAYGSFGSFFGLANLTSQNPDFYGIVNYAASMVFELVTNATVESGEFPSSDDMSVRFLFSNGTADVEAPPIAYPLFGGTEELISWNDFVTEMAKISVGTEEEWCSVCQNTTGTCAQYVTSGGSNSSSSSSSGSGTTSDEKSGNGLSPAVNGVIGAMVTLAVVLGVEALVLLVGGFRIVRKSRVGGADGAVQTVDHAHAPKA